MKKRYFMPLCLSVGMLLSCVSTNESSNDTIPSEENVSSIVSSSSNDSRKDSSSESSSSNSQKGSSESSQYVPPIDTNSGDKAYIYSTLMAAANSGNYTVEYEMYDTEGNVTSTLKDTVTRKYITRNYANTGYLLLKSYNQTEFPNDIYYEYDKEGSSIKITNAHRLDGASYRTPANEGDFLYRMNLLGSLANPENRVTEEFVSYDAEHGIYSDKQAFIVACGTLLGYKNASITGRIAEVRFGVREDKSVIIQLYTWEDANDDENTRIVPLAKGFLTKVGETVNQELEDFISSFSLPTESLPEEASKLALDNKIKAKTEMNKISSEGVSSWKASVSLEANENEKKIHNRYDNVRGAIDDCQYLRKSASGYAEEVYINGNNEIASKRTSYLWEDLSYRFLKEYFDPLACRKTDDGSYHYFGPGADGIIESLCDYNYVTFGNVRSLDLTYENNALSFHGLGYAYTDGHHYEFVTNLETPTAISLEKYAVNSEEENYQKLSTAFSYFQNESNVWQAHEINNSNNDTITNRDIGDYYHTGDYSFYVPEFSGKESYGYLKTEDGVQPFSISYKLIYKNAETEDPSDHFEGRAVRSGDVQKGKTLSDFMSFSTHPELFTKVSENKYAVKPFVDGVGLTMFPKDDDDAKDYDTYITLGEDGKVSTYEYWSPNNGGYRKLTFNYQSISVENDKFYFSDKDFIDFSPLKVNSSWLTWETGYASFYNYQLLKVFKEKLGMSDADAKTAADSVPYLALDYTDSSYPFSYGPIDGVTLEISLDKSCGTSSNRQIYANKYAAYLLKCGYTKGLDSSNKECYKGTYCDIYFGTNTYQSTPKFTFVCHKAA